MNEEQQLVAPATDTPIPETSVEQAVKSGDQSAYKLARAAEKSGKPLPTNADPSPAEPVAQVASTDASPQPASEPGTPKPKSNAETRIKELLAETKELKTKLDAATRPPSQVPDVPQAASSPAPVAVVKFPSYDDWSAKQPDDRASYEEYIDARAVHVFQQQQQAHDEQHARTAAQRDQAARIQAYQQRADTFVAAHPDYAAVVNPLASGTPVTPTSDAIGDLVARSDVGPQLLYHLGTHLEVFQRLVSLPERLAVYELGKLEASFAAPATPNPEPRTHVPEPPTTLGRRSADPSDPTEAIVASGDQAAYKAQRQRDRLAQLRH